MKKVPNSEDQPRNSERDWTVWGAPVLTGIVLGALAAGAFHPVQVRWPASLLRVVRVVTLTLVPEQGILTRLVSDATLNRILLFSPLLTGFLAGFLGGIQWELFLKLLRQHIFPTRDPKVIIPIPAPRSEDPLWGNILAAAKDKDGKPIADPIGPMAWIMPSQGPRLEAWKSLWQFIHDGSSDGRYAFFRKGPWGRFLPTSEDYKPFRWTVLTGRSGSGKTRMAAEFLRRKLARIQELGELGTPRLPKSNNTSNVSLRSHWKHWSARKRIEWGEWVRRHAPWSKRKITNPEQQEPGDPWDISWVNQSPSYRKRAGIAEFLDALTTWRPRRPTAFLLDDLEDCRRAIERARPVAAAFPTHSEIQDNWRECLRILKQAEAIYLKPPAPLTEGHPPKKDSALSSEKTSTVPPQSASNGTETASPPSDSAMLPTYLRYPSTSWKRPT